MRSSALLLIPCLLAAACNSPEPTATDGAATDTSATASQDLPGQLHEDYSYLLGTDEVPLEGGTIRRHLESDLNSLNPVLASQTYESYVNRYIFDELYQYDGDLKIVPVMATSLPAIDASGTVYTVKLRDDIKWHDGKPFTAHDVKFTMDMIQHPKVPAVNLRASFDFLKQVKLIDDHTLQFIWKEPFAPAMAMLCNILPIPKHLYETNKIEDFATQEIGRRPIGSGAFKFVEWKSGQSVTVVRNEDYWGPKVYPEKVIFKIIDNRQVALKACRADQLDDQLVPTDQWFTEAATPEFMAQFNRVITTNFGFNYVAFNTRNALFSDARVRRALTHLRDREGMIRDFYQGTASIISGPFNPDTEWHDPTVEPLAYDPELAVELLTEAGWVDSDGDGLLDKDGVKFEFEFAYPSGNTISTQTGATLQESLKTVGIHMEIRGYEGSTFFEILKKGEFEAATLGWRLDPDPEWVYALFHSSQIPGVGVNHGYFSDPEVDRLVEAQRRELDHDKRRALMHQIHRRLRDQAPYLFDITVHEKRVYRKTIRGIQVNPYTPFYVTPGGAGWFLTRGMATAS